MDHDHVRYGHNLAKSLAKLGLCADKLKFRYIKYDLFSSVLCCSASALH